MRLFFEETHEEVELPQGLVNFRGKEMLVERILEPSSPGKSGKIECAGGQVFYPGVVGCYIADEPRS
jgi:hypothetical protein